METKWALGYPNEKQPWGHVYPNISQQSHAQVDSAVLHYITLVCELLLCSYPLNMNPESNVIYVPLVVLDATPTICPTVFMG